jgi:hypothetical protein
MRAGPLSNARVVALLNRYFVPVYAINEDYRAKGVVPEAEKAEYQRIYREALRARLSTGTVHVYIVAPDGHPIDSLHVATASRVERLLDLLERTFRRLKTAEGKPLVKPTAQSAAPKRAADSLLLHLTARYLVRRGTELVTLRDRANLGQTRNGSWHALPSENWIVLDRAEWARLLPAGAVRAGSSWELDQEAAGNLLRHFYPQTENNDVRKNRITAQALRATVLSVKDGVARARLDGRLTMKHSFYHRDDDNVVEATLLGVLDFEPGKKQIRSLQLVTDRATYGRSEFGVAVRLITDH